MNQRRNKHRLRAHLVFVYGLMAIAIISIVAILILIVQGYRYNKYDGKLEQGGLVQFDSRPSGATVTVDGIGLANRTASKITLTSGQHTVMMSRDGYGSWTREVTVKPGTILWLNYALLYPNKPTLSTATSFDTVTSALVSPESKRMGVVASDMGVVHVTTLDTDTPVTTKVTLPSDSYTAAADGEQKSLTLINWDKDGKYLLVRYMHGAASEYLSINTEDSSVRNITKSLGVDVSSAAYSLADSNVVYLLTTAHELRRATLSDMTVSGPLATNVTRIAITEKNTVLFATLPDEKGVRSLGYVTTGATKSKTIKSYPGLSADAALTAASGSYYGDHYIVLNHGDVVDMYTATLPASESNDDIKLNPVSTMTIPGGAAYLGFSSESNRIVYAQRDALVMTYDLELDTAARITLAGAPLRQVDWLDGYHIGSTVGGNATYSDFDGTNGVSVATNVNDQPIALANGNKYLYYFTTTNGVTKLMRAKMTS